MNPYEASESTSTLGTPPSSNDNPSPDGKQFQAEGVSVGADRVTGWFAYGFEQFKASPGIWIGLVLIFAVIIIILSKVPFLGSIALYILYPVFVGGLMLACHAYAQKQEVKIEHLFAGFKDKFGPLALVGLLYFAAIMVMVVALGIIAAIFIGGVAASGSMAGFGSNLTQGGIAALLGLGLGVLLAISLFFLVVSIPMFMAFWMAPILVVLHNIAPIEAIKCSFSASMKNIGAILLYGLLCFFAAIVASIPLGLGWLVLGPVLVGTIYAAYRDFYFS